MPPTCFVIMPFSGTQSCTEEEWTALFDTVFRPAIESAAPGYECKRSTATRGNIVKAILQDLNDAHVVVADLTDRNPNVFYELGVRHTLKNRTILLAQRKDDIPFDLQAYAYHVYEWKSDPGKTAMRDKLRELLLDVGTNPNRADNPVSDFLRGASPAGAPASPAQQDLTEPRSLVGEGAEGIDAASYARKIIQTGQPQKVDAIFRMTRRELLPRMQAAMRASGNRQHEALQDIPAVAQEYINAAEPLVHKVEEFVLTCVQDGWKPGALFATKSAGDWLSLSIRTVEGVGNRFAQGLPALLAWRLLALAGAKALAEEHFSLLRVIFGDPIEVEDDRGNFSNLPLIQRHELYYSEAFLGQADHTINYIKTLWAARPHLQPFFESDDNYRFALAKFLMALGLGAPLGKSGHPLYPGYRHLSQAQRAMSSLCSRLRASAPYLEGIAHALGESPDDFRRKWPERAASQNNMPLESLWFLDVARFPEVLDGKTGP